MRSSPIGLYVHTLTIAYFTMILRCRKNRNCIIRNF